MKKTALLLAILLAVCAAAALEIILNDGRQYKGDILSSQENRLIIQDDGIVIQIPSDRIKSVLDNGQDVTGEMLKKAAMGQGTDIHYIEEDDFFVSEVPLEKNPYMPVKTAKMINPPTRESKMQAQFILTSDGSQLWTKDYYTTKVANVEGLKPEMEVICFEGKSDTGIFTAPLNEDEKRNGTWFMARIADMSSIGEGYIILSNDYKVSLDNIRVITK
jgi:hypothetical protein